MHEAEAERDEPPPVQARTDDVLERHVDDGAGDEHLDERREPERVGPEVVGRGDERDRVRDGEGRDDGDQRAEAAERDDQAEQEQQVVGAVQNVLEAKLHEAPRGLEPARVEFDQARVAPELEGADRVVRQHQSDCRDRALAETPPARLDREARAGRLDRIGEEDIEVAGRHRDVDVALRNAQQRQGAVETLEGAVVRRRRPYRHHRLRAQFLPVLEDRDVVADPEGGRVAQGLRRPFEVEDVLVLVAPRHVTHGNERHADQQRQLLAAGLHEALDQGVVGDLVRREHRGHGDREGNQESGAETAHRGTAGLHHGF